MTTKLFQIQTLIKLCVHKPCKVIGPVTSDPYILEQVFGIKKTNEHESLSSDVIDSREGVW